MTFHPFGIIIVINILVIGGVSYENSIYLYFTHDLSARKRYSHLGNRRRWKIRFRNISCQIKSETETITLEDISIGDVFLAGSQSNMEFWMRYDADMDEVRDTCGNPDIRFYDCPEISYEGQDQDFDYSRMGFWRTV